MRQSGGGQRSAAAASATNTAAAEAAACASLYGVPANIGPDQLSACQWDMRAIGATPAGSYAVNRGAGARIGDIDTGIDLTNTDIMPNVDVANSCVFLYADTPTADPAEQVTRGDCSNKAALQDLAGHGTHTAGIMAAPINGLGVSGVAPQAKVVVLKAGTAQGFFFTQSVVDALRYAGDQHLDVVNMSFFADPWLFNCRNDKEQKAIIQAISAAARYAQQRGVLLVAAAGNDGINLSHPTVDEISPDFPPGAATTRPVNNSCVVLPTELPGVVVVTATGAQNLLAWYSTYGNATDVTAPGRLPVPDPDVRSQPGTGAVDVLGHRRRPRRRGRARAARPGHQRQLLRLAERDVDGSTTCRGRRGADPSCSPRDAARRGRGPTSEHRHCPTVPTGARPRCRVLRCSRAGLQRRLGEQQLLRQGAGERAGRKPLAQGQLSRPGGRPGLRLHECEREASVRPPRSAYRDRRAAD